MILLLSVEVDTPKWHEGRLLGQYQSGGDVITHRIGRASPEPVNVRLELKVAPEIADMFDRCRTLDDLRSILELESTS